MSMYRRRKKIRNNKNHNNKIVREDLRVDTLPHHIREELADLYRDGEVVRFFGEYVRTGRSITPVGYSKSILLKDLVNVDGVLLTDHMWVNLNSRNNDQLGYIKSGDIITFEAEIAIYAKTTKDTINGASTYNDYAVDKVDNICFYFGTEEQMPLFSYNGSVPKPMYGQDDTDFIEFTECQLDDLARSENINDLNDEECLYYNDACFYARMGTMSERKTTDGLIKTIQLTGVRDADRSLLIKETWFDFDIHPELVKLGEIEKNSIIKLKGDVSWHEDTPVITENGLIKEFEELLVFTHIEHAEVL